MCSSFVCLAWQRLLFLTWSSAQSTPFGSTNMALGPLKLSEWLGQEPFSLSQSTAFLLRLALLYLLSRSHFSSFLGVGTSVMRKGIPQEATDRAYPAPGWQPSRGSSDQPRGPQRKQNCGCCTCTCTCTCTQAHTHMRACTHAPQDVTFINLTLHVLSIKDWGTNRLSSKSLSLSALERFYL